MRPFAGLARLRCDGVQVVGAGRGLLGLAPGRRILLNAVEWTVESVEPQFGRFVLSHADGQVELRSIRWLISHPDARMAKAVGSGHGIQPRTVADLTPEQHGRARIRAEHVLEAMTGFRSGHPSRAQPGEPRPAYDPGRTTLTERRLVKVAELKAMPPQEAELLGLRFMSLRTLERLSSATVESLLLACADGRWTRRSEGHRSITEEVREAIFAVRKECKDRARIGMAAKHRLLHQYMKEKFPQFPTEKIPSRTTLWRVWHEWFGPGGGRQRYERSADEAEEAGVARRVVVHRPGQVLALDSTPMPVKLRETVFGDAVTATLTLALDLYSHSLPAFRLTLQSDTSVDVAMLLRDVMLPLPMREGWGEEMQWPYPGVPADVIAEFTGCGVATLPFFAPETVTTDHGSPYKNHDLVDAERVLGCNILPARTLRASDKFAVERAFSSIKTLLFEHLLGFTGTDVADRGADPEGYAVFTLARMEHLIASWIVQVWQNRKLGEYAPAWGPGEDHSPNSLFAAAMLQGGFSLQIPEPELLRSTTSTAMPTFCPCATTAFLKPWSTRAFCTVSVSAATLSSSAMPTAFSCADAAATTTAITSPRTSTARPRLRPGTFLPHHVPSTARALRPRRARSGCRAPPGSGPPSGPSSPAPASAAGRGWSGRCRRRARCRSSTSPRRAAGSRVGAGPTDSLNGLGRAAR